jgi:GT2 family glycosyltransferase
VATGVPRVSVIIPTYRRPGLLRQCLGSLQQQTADAASFEVVIVDDASGDESTEILAATATRWPTLRWASHSVNRGPAAARNLAASMARGEVLLFLDDDIAAAPELIATHLNLHAHSAALQGFVGLVQWHPSLTVTPFMRWLDSTDLQFRFETTLVPGRVPSPDQAFYTCNLSLRRAVFEIAGGFDEHFPYPAYEDVELGWRLGQAGFVLDYTPEALAFHTRAITLPEFTRRMAFVAESAVRLRAVQPEVDVTIVRPKDGPAATVARVAARLGARVRPQWGGHDVRSRYFWAEIEHAYARGLRRAGHR